MEQDVFRENGRACKSNAGKIIMAKGSFNTLRNKLSPDARMAATGKAKIILGKINCFDCHKLLCINACSEKGENFVKIDREVDQNEDRRKGR